MTETYQTNHSSIFFRAKYANRPFYMKTLLLWLHLKVRNVSQADYTGNLPARRHFHCHTEIRYNTV